MGIKAILVILILLPLCLYSQGWHYDDYTFIVIAPNGLKLREGPGTMFKTLDAAAFGSEVMMLGISDEPMDTVQSYTNSEFPEYVYEVNVTATWVNVKFGKKIGYMYSLYLYPKCTHMGNTRFSDMNKNYQLFSKENDDVCLDFNSPKQNYWYEIIQEADGIFSLRNIKVELISSLDHLQNCGGGFQLIVQKEDRKSQSLILYSKKKLTVGKLDTQKLSDLNSRLKSIKLGAYDEINGKTLMEYKIKKNKLLEKYSLRVTSGEDDTMKIYFNKNGKEVLFLEHHDITIIHLVADLDRDGIMDFIITFGDYNQVSTRLLLSSEAEEGNSHKCVATLAGEFNC